MQVTQFQANSRLALSLRTLNGRQEQMELLALACNGKADDSLPPIVTTANRQPGANILAPLRGVRKRGKAQTCTGRTMGPNNARETCSGRWRGERLDGQKRWLWRRLSTCVAQSHSKIWFNICLCRQTQALFSLLLSQSTGSRTEVGRPDAHSAKRPLENCLSPARIMCLNSITFSQIQFRLSRSIE